MRFLFSEHRLIPFGSTGGASGGPAGAPGAAPSAAPDRMSLHEAVKKLIDKLDSDEAVAEVQKTLAAIAGKDQQEANSLLSAVVQKAAQLEYRYVKGTLEGTKGPEIAQQDALTEVQEDFADFAINFDVDTSGELVASSAETAERPEPTNHWERIWYEGEDAIAVLFDKNTSFAEKAKALGKIWMLFNDFTTRLENGTLEDPYESEKTKQDKEKHRKHQERITVRNEIRAAVVPPKTLAKHRENVEKSKAEKTTALTTAKGDLDAEQKNLEGLQKRLASPVGKDDAEKTTDRKNTEALIKASQEKIAKLQTDVGTLEKEVGKLQTTLEEVDAMLAEREKIPSRVAATLKRFGQALTQHPAERVKLLGKALAAMGDPVPAGGMHYKLVDTAGNPILDATGKGVDESLKEVLEKHFGKKVIEEDMGMNAAGVVTDTQKLLAFFSDTLRTDMLQMAEVAHNKMRIEIYNVIADKDADGTTNPHPFTGGGKEQILRAIHKDTKEGAWQSTEVGGETGEVTYVNGEVWFQPTDGNVAASRLNTTAKPAVWEQRTSMYFTGEESKPIPEPTDADKRGRLYAYERKGDVYVWREKTIEDMFGDGSDTVQDSFGTDIPAGDMQKALASKDWVDSVTWPEREMFYDGNRTLIIQSKDAPASVEVFDVTEFGDTGDMKMRFEANAFFNGSEIVEFTGDLADLTDDGKRERGYNYESRTYTPKSRTEMLTVIIKDLGGFDGKDTEALDNPKTWQDHPSTVAKDQFDYYFDGTDLYFQKGKGDLTKKFDFDAYVQTGAIDMDWVDLPGEYLNGAGKLVPDKDDKTHEYDRTLHEWVFDAKKAVNNLTPVTPDQLVGLQYFKDKTEWADHPVDLFSDYEGIRAGNMIYVQLIDSPDTLWVADLEKGTYTKKPKWYFDGTSEKKVPAERFRTTYASRTWEELTPEQSTQRKEVRLLRGKNIFGSLSSGYSAVETSGVYALEKGGIKVIDCRLSTASHKWEWSPHGASTWNNFEVSIPAATLPAALRPDAAYLDGLRGQFKDINASHDLVDA